MKFALAFMLIWANYSWSIPDCTSGWSLPSKEEIHDTIQPYSELPIEMNDPLEDRAKMLILAYVGGRFHEELNEAIRRGVETTPDSIEYIKIGKWIDQALCIAPFYQGNVYRGIKSKFNYVVNEVVTFKSFTSTSKNKESAENFGTQTFYVITSKKGRDISKISFWGHEEEVLFPKDTQFKILKVTRDNVIYMEEL